MKKEITAITINGAEYLRDDPVEMKPGYRMWTEFVENAGCNNGNYRRWGIIGPHGQVVASGITCRCGRGCSGTDCIRDDWNYRDTVIERYRA